jgi:hypothetical protein
MESTTTYTYFRSRPRRGQTFPIKKSVLDDFCADATGLISRVSMVTLPDTAFARADRNRARVDWNGRDRYPPERASLMVYSVPSAEAARSRELILEIVLPAICDWLREFDRATDTRRSENHSLHFSVRDGEVVRAED